MKACGNLSDLLPQRQDSTPPLLHRDRAGYNWGSTSWRARVKRRGRLAHPRILLSLSFLCPLWSFLRTVSKSRTTKSSEGAENHFISKAFAGARVKRRERLAHHRILLSLSSLCPLWSFLRTGCKSGTKESSEGAENHFISKAFAGARVKRRERLAHHRILLSLSSLCPLWSFLRTGCKSGTKESSEGAENHFISKAFAGARVKRRERLAHQRILLFLSSLCPLWSFLRTVSKSRTTESSEGATNHFFSKAFAGARVKRRERRPHHPILLSLSSLCPLWLILRTVSKGRSTGRSLGALLSAFVFALLAWTGFTPVQVRAEALTKVRLLTDWYPDPERGGYYCAQIKGYYRAAGLDVEIIPGGPNNGPIQRLLTGRLEFLLSTSGDVLVQAAKGLPLVGVAAVMQHDPQAILVHESSPVRQLADLEGRTVTATPGAVWLQYVRKRYGLTHLRESPSTQSIATFVHNTNEILQCFVTAEPYFAREAGIKTRTLLIEDDQFKPYRVLVTSRIFVEQHPETVRAFVNATLRGWKDYLTDPTEINRELLRLNPELNPSKMEYSWKALKDGNFVLGNPAEGEIQGVWDQKRLKSEADILKELGLLKKDFDYHLAFDERFSPSGK